MASIAAAKRKACKQFTSMPSAFLRRRRLLPLQHTIHYVSNQRRQVYGTVWLQQLHQAFPLASYCSSPISSSSSTCYRDRAGLAVIAAHSKAAHVFVHTYSSWCSRRRHHCFAYNQTRSSWLRNHEQARSLSTPRSSAGDGTTGDEAAPHKDHEYRSSSNSSNDSNSDERLYTKNKMADYSSMETVGGGGFKGQPPTMRFRDDPIDIESRRSIWRGREKFASKSKRMMVVAMVGNAAICLFKTFAWWSSGSSAMLNTAVHSFIDTLNQALNLVGLSEADHAPDMKHQYGYGKEVYFWSLVSAIGTFWLGAGVTFTHTVSQFFQPEVVLDSVNSWTVGVLSFGMAVDGFVLFKSIEDVWHTKPKDISVFRAIREMRDPTRKAVIFEDAAAIVGVGMASVGTVATHVTGDPVYDSIAGLGISILLGFMGYKLMHLNRMYLVGVAVDEAKIARIQQIMMARPSIDAVHSIQSQWVSPWNFSFKAEVDLDGTFVAATLLPHYKELFIGEVNEENLALLMSFYAEDVIRMTEREVRSIEAEIRSVYPEAAFIDIELDSKMADMIAVEEHKKASARKAERESLNRILKDMARDSMLKVPMTAVSTRSLRDIPVMDDPITGNDGDSIDENVSAWASYGANIRDEEEYDEQEHVDSNTSIDASRWWGVERNHNISNVESDNYMDGDDYDEDEETRSRKEMERIAKRKKREEDDD